LGEKYDRKWNDILEEGNALGKVIARRFIDIFKEELVAFDKDLVMKLVEKVKVVDCGLKFCFLDGSEV